MRTYELMNPPENKRYNVPVRVAEGDGAIRAARNRNVQNEYVGPDDVYQRRDTLAAYFSSPEGVLRYL